MSLYVCTHTDAKGGQGATQSSVGNLMTTVSYPKQSLIILTIASFQHSLNWYKCTYK
jgi:hypothetical protein